MKRTLLPFVALMLLGATAPRLPSAPSHVIVIIEENKSYGDIIGNIREAPYINALAASAAVFTDSHAVTHPSQPNYMALFSGHENTDGDSCRVSGISRDARSLGGEAIEAKLTFVGYAEGLPARGSAVCYAGEYARKHVPWVHFADVPITDNVPFADFPNYDRLPTIAFVIPNLLNDMHSASIERGDAWLRQYIDPLVAWSMKHNTMIVITWDEDDGSASNQIPTLLLGPMVEPGRYSARITHYNVLRTIEAFYHLPALGESALATPIESVWR